MWRIRIDTACKQLAVEVRDADLLLAHFYTLATEAFTLRKLDLNPSKAWWQGLEDAQQGMLYLHGYGDRKTGQHKGISAIHTSSGEQSWEAEALAFYGFAEGGLLAYTADSPEEALMLLDPENGNLLRTGIAQQEAAKLVAGFNPVRYADAIFPVLYLEGEPYFNDVSQFIRVQAGQEPVKGIEYAETDQYIVVSYYTPTAAGHLDNFVEVYDLEGNLQLKVKLGSGLSGIGSDTFFIFNLRLYLLLDKQVLQVYGF